MKKYFTISYIIMALLFLAALVYPLSKILYLGLHTDSGFGLTNFRDLFQDHTTFQGISNSFMLAACVGLVVTILGFVLAYTRNFVKTYKWFHNFLEVFANFPMFLPTIVYGFALIYVFGRQGLLTQLLGGKTLITVFGPQGIFLGWVIYTLPVAFMLINNSMKYINPKLFVVSKLMGDNGLRQFVTCLLRPLLITLVLSFVQCFFLSFTDFGLPVALAGNYPLLATSLYTRMLGAIPDFAHGAAIAILMLLPTIVTTVVMVILQKYNVKNTVKSSVEWYGNNIARIFFVIISTLLLVGVVGIFIPIFIVPFVVSYPYDMTFTSLHIRTIFSDVTIFGSIGHSLLLSILTALIGTNLALVGAYLSARSSISSQVSMVFAFISNVTNAIPGMVLGVALMIAISGTSLQNTMFILIVANCVHLFATPFSMADMALHKLSANLETTSELMGDNFIQTVFRVVLPNIRQTVFEMMSYLFVNSMVTISALIFLVGVDTATITTKMKELQQFNRFDQVFALALLLFIINLLIKYLMHMFGNFKLKRIVTY
ncbi:ABC transporter permease subunit [Lactococcus lactis subsp. lactis]|uniref:ABC transporter permease n=1 Tax=Lactococcus lactis TaxID=1358 RepID=UPI0021AF2486|nr:ABC transporter permease subunit [Lactococcus lactis]MCT0017227.1 ABC transporter permease subunit [Lactococcus lactis subsp. lactis]